MRAIIFLGLIAASLAIWLYRRQYAARAMRKVEAGQQCIACNSTDVTAEGWGVRCRNCGHFTDAKMLQRLGHAQVDADEMANMSKPDGD